MNRGHALALDKLTINAALAAADGRSADALAQYREAFRGWRSLGLAWDEALAVIDMAKFLGVSDPEMEPAVDWARETLTRLGAKPYLARLDEVIAAAPAADAGPKVAPAPTREVTAPVS